MTAGRLRPAIAVVAAAGAALTGYLTGAALLETETLCPTSGCDVVLSSTYSELLGVPISALGLFAFLAILASSAHPRGAFPGAALAIGSVFYAAYLVVVQLVVIDAVCTLCLLSHTLMVTAAGLTSARLLAEPGP